MLKLEDGLSQRRARGRGMLEPEISCGTVSDRVKDMLEQEVAGAR